MSQSPEPTWVEFACAFQKHSQVPRKPRDMAVRSLSRVLPRLAVAVHVARSVEGQVRHSQITQSPFLVPLVLLCDDCGGQHQSWGDGDRAVSSWWLSPHRGPFVEASQETGTAMSTAHPAVFGAEYLLAWGLLLALQGVRDAETDLCPTE